MSASLGLRQQTLEPVVPAQHSPRGAAASSARRRSRRPAKVLILDADEIVRLGVRGLLAGDAGLAVVGDADTIAAAVRQAMSLRPAVVIVAGHPTDGSMRDACLRLRTTGARAIVLARDSRAASIVDAVRAGAMGYFAAPIVREDLCRAVRAIARGDVLIDASSTRALLDGIRRGVMPATAALADQERRVLALVAQGKTNREIAAALHLSDKTVKNYLSRAFDKLSVTRRAQAAVVYARTFDAH
jgi:DNA-binding NarL/FixJ family response regulator